VAEHAVDLLGAPLGFSVGDWTHAGVVPGGDLPGGDFEAFRRDSAARYPWIAEPTLTRLCRAYGTRIGAVLGGATAWDQMGRDFGAGLTETEVRYLVEREWAVEPDDVLWRRTKLGLHMSPAERAAFGEAFA
jgi:glycerol-3-phosphate dehydrogenase